MQPRAVPQSPLALTRAEVQKLVYKYIGVSGGYLGDFSYRTHEEFYVGLDLDIDPSEHGSTTRERFVNILQSSAPAAQARILQGILERYPVGSSDRRTSEIGDEIRTWIGRLQGAAPVAAPDLRITSSVVERALRDAEELLRTSGATSGVDRAHTALHGYLRAVCIADRVEVSDEAASPELFKMLREQHPAFRDLGPRSDDILKMLRSLGSIIDTLSPLRNKASVAHPNEVLLSEPEAMLVINVARSVMRYIDDKLHEHVRRTGSEIPF